MHLSVLFILIGILLAVICYHSKHDDKREGMGGGGFSTITALSLYNTPHHCWKNLYGGGTSCGTDSALML